MPHLVDNPPLLQAFRDGTQGALAEVYRLYAPSVIGFLRGGFSFESQGRAIPFRGAKASFELESLVQETFVRAFADRARLSYDGLRPYTSYLCAIAKNLVADNYRKRAVSFVSMDEAAVEAVDRDTPAPDARAADAELARLVGEFQATLEPLERQLFALRLGDGETQAAVAARLGITEYRVRFAEERLRRRFFALLRRHGYLEGRAAVDVAAAALLLLLAFLPAATTMGAPR